jgi:hypothetical protein
LSFYPEPTDIEPTFIPFFGHQLPERKKFDDGVRPRFFPGIVHEFNKLIGTNSDKNGLQEDEAVAYLNELYPNEAFQDNSVGEDVTELGLVFANDLRVGFEYMEELLLLLSEGTEHVSFEIVATSSQISVQFACRDSSVKRIRAYISEYLPDVIIQERPISIIEPFDETSRSWSITELALAEEFTRPLRIYNRFEPDPYAALIASMSNLHDGECVVFQVLFKAIHNPWGQSILWAVSDNKGRSFFEGDETMLRLAQEKVSKPLCVCCPRIAVFTDSEYRTNELNRLVLHGLNPITKHGSNHFEPIQHPSVTPAEILYRHSFRTGMVVNVGELASMVHIPDQTVKSEKLRYGQAKTKELPQSATGHDFVLGTNVHLGNEVLASLSTATRLRHMHVIGATGTGKSNFFLGCIKQDMELGNGLCVLDPHGDLIEKSLLHVPDDRIQDVIIIDPSDEDFPVGLNLLSATTEAEKIILSSDLVALFRRFATSWGDQMTSVLANAINAFLSREEQGTLIELKRFLTEKKFRESILQTVSDPTIVYFWQHEFPQLRSGSVASILTRLDTFLRSPLVRNMMAQRKGLDFHSIINSKKILLVKLSQGLIGEENSYLLGSIIIAKLHQAALHRQTMKEAERIPFFLYVDEFQHFITPSMSAILSGARKYGLGLNMAHQDMEQVRVIDRELANSILANPATRVIFRCGEQDGKQLGQGISYFDETDLQNLSIGNAIVRVERKDQDFNISTSFVQNSLGEDVSEAKTRAIVEWSRKAYGGDRSAIEAELKKQYGISNLQVQSPPKPPVNPVQPIPTDQAVSSKPEPGDFQSKAAEFVRKETGKNELREHQYLQELLKRTGESFGFKSIIEEPIDGGRVDVGMRRDNLQVACEVSVTTSVEHELDNIEKCLRTGYDYVLSVSKNEEHLQKIRILANEKLEAKELLRVSFLLPEKVGAFLTSITPKEVLKEQTVKGYRVKVEFDEVDDADRISRQKSVVKAVLRSKNHSK